MPENMPRPSMLPASNRFARKATENHTDKVHLGSSLEMWLCVYKHPKTVEKYLPGDRGLWHLGPLLLFLTEWNVENSGLAFWRSTQLCECNTLCCVSRWLADENTNRIWHASRDQGSRMRGAETKSKSIRNSCSIQFCFTSAIALCVTEGTRPWTDRVCTVVDMAWKRCGWPSTDRDVPRTTYKADVGTSVDGETRLVLWEPDSTGAL